MEALLRSDELPVISEIEASGPSGGVLGGGERCSRGSREDGLQMGFMCPQKRCLR